MARLPNPGSDSGVWGNILNDFLLVSHNDDGTIKNSAVPGTADATTTANGVVRLAGDLGGTGTSANAPVISNGAITTVKIDDRAVTGLKIGLTTVTDANIAVGAAIAQSKVDGLVTALAAKEDLSDKGVADGYAPLDGSSLVPIANLPTGASGSTVAFGNHTHTEQTALSAFTISGALATGTGISRLPLEGSYSIVGIRLMANTAPVGADIIIDVNKNSSTIFSTQGNRPAIADGANSGGPGTTPDTTTLEAGDYLTVDIDQVGSTTPGSDLVVSVVVTKIIG